MPNTEKKKQEVINLLKGSVIVDLHFSMCLDASLIKGFTVEKDGALYVITLEEAGFYSKASPYGWLEVHDPKSLERLY